ncbi:MAG: hypothetical protein R3Y16_07485 [Rikenellaceae bacterium]
MRCKNEEEIQGVEIIIDDLFEGDEVVEESQETNEIDHVKIFDNRLEELGLGESYFEELEQSSAQQAADREEYETELDRLENEEDVEVIMEETEDI